ncbi:MAG: AAA family ATPase, partial [Cyanobacteria bacterium P01_H01_bin.130]
MNKQQKSSGGAIAYDSLTPDQREACDGIVEFLTDSAAGQEVVLTGYAGTGKTTVIATAIKRFLEEQDEIDPFSILLAGPTHTACKVLRSTFWRAGMNLEVATYASMLG